MPPGARGEESAAAAARVKRIRANGRREPAGGWYRCPSGQHWHPACLFGHLYQPPAGSRRPFATTRSYSDAGGIAGIGADGADRGIGATGIGDTLAGTAPVVVPRARFHATTSSDTTATARASCVSIPFA